MLGSLATYLRLCGHDTVYALDRDVEDDDRLLAIAREEDRTLVSRDVHLTNRADRAILLTTRGTEPQLRELAAAGVSLVPTDDPVFCGRCNGRLEPVPADAPVPEYVPDDADDQRQVSVCTECGQHFWKGSHWERMVRTLENVR